MFTNNDRDNAPQLHSQVQLSFLVDLKIYKQDPYKTLFSGKMQDTHRYANLDGEILPTTLNILELWTRGILIKIFLDPRTAEPTTS